MADAGQHHRIIEFFCGVGGLHYAMSESGVKHQVACAFDVDNMALATYSLNHPKTATSSADIVSLTEGALARLAADTWLLSPPCQPYTRQGDAGRRDRNRDNGTDGRANALERLIQLLGSCDEATLPSFLFLENVVGFESSATRSRLTAILIQRGFYFRELWASPIHFGVPNQRTRYFLLARRTADFGDWGGQSPMATDINSGAQSVEEHLHLLQLDQASIDAAIAEGRRVDAPTGMPDELVMAKCGALDSYLLPKDSEQLQQLAVPDHVLERYGLAMDFVTRQSCRTCCFTKNYSRYIKGTGSILLEAVTTMPTLHDAPSLEDLRVLRPRFFAPSEIAAIHGFPRSFAFPAHITRKKQYELLGNSLSVPVVTLLVRALFAPAPT